MSWIGQQVRRLLRGEGGVELRQLRATGIAADVATAVGRASYTGHAPELLEALEERAAAEIGAAAAQEIDPAASVADACRIDQLEMLRADVLRARERHVAARLRREEAEDAFQSLARPIGFLGHVARFLTVLLGTAVLIAAITGLLAPSVEAFLLRGYVSYVLQADAETYAAAVAAFLALLVTSALFGTQLALVVVARGRIHWTRKLAFVLADIGFAGAFAIMRLGETFSWQAASVSVFEFALSIAGTALVFGYAQVLRENEEPAKAYRTAAHHVALGRRAERVARSAVRTAARRLEAYVEELGRREDAVRRRGAMERLGRACVTATYLAEASALIDEHVRDDSGIAFAGEVARVRELPVHLGKRRKP